jgi:triosephosphate isomerase
MIIAANFKTNHTRQSTNNYFEVLDTFMKNEKIEDEAILFPTSTSLQYGKKRFIQGVQNAYPVQNGSFTGEIGVDQLAEFEIDTVLIGHSERRHILHESDELIKQKFNFFAKAGFRIIYCIGESLSTREEGEDSVMDYLATQLEGIDTSYENLVVAYEPVWAIGTGKTATITDIEHVHESLKERYPLKHLLYGGSVKVENAAEILMANEVDGLLIGTTSWDADKFKEILSISKNLKK